MYLTSSYCGLSSYHGYIIHCCSQEVEEARAALQVHSASVEQLQNQLKVIQGQLDNEEIAREHARMLQRSAIICLRVEHV